MDPRVKTSPVDLQKMFGAESLLAKNVAELSTALRQAKDLQASIAARNQEAAGKARVIEPLRVLDRKTAELLGAERDADFGIFGLAAPASSNVTLRQALWASTGLLSVVRSVGCRAHCRCGAGHREMGRRDKRFARALEDILAVKIANAPTNCCKRQNSSRSSAGNANATFLGRAGYIKANQEPGSRKGHPMNRISKQIAITASFVLLSMFPALSKAQNTAPDTAQDQSQAMQSQRGEKGDFLANLNLTDDQKVQIKQIREGARSQADAVKNDCCAVGRSERSQAACHPPRQA